MVIILKRRTNKFARGTNFVPAVIGFLIYGTVYDIVKKCRWLLAKSRCILVQAYVMPMT